MNGTEHFINLTISIPTEEGFENGLEVTVNLEKFNDFDQVKIFEKAFVSLLDSPKEIILNLKNVKYASSFFIGSLINCINKANSNECKLCIIPSLEIVEIFKIANIEKFVMVKY